MSRERPLEGKRILVVEDDYYLATDEKALLERAGASVVGPFGSSSRERDLEAAGSIDGAVLDINLGEGPSFALADALEQRRVPFLFLTGYDSASIPPSLAGVERIEKPAEIGRVVEAVGRLAGA